MKFKSISKAFGPFKVCSLRNTLLSLKVSLAKFEFVFRASNKSKAIPGFILHSTIESSWRVKGQLLLNMLHSGCKHQDKPCKGVHYLMDMLAYYGPLVLPVPTSPFDFAHPRRYDLGSNRMRLETKGCWLKRTDIVQMYANILSSVMHGPFVHFTICI